MSPSHQERECEIMGNLEAAFPSFTGVPRNWTAVTQGADPPDFISRIPEPAVGLELTEWLDGDQMLMAKARETRREQIQAILANGRQNAWRPQHFRVVIPTPRYERRIDRNEQESLRDEFYARVKSADSEAALNIQDWHPSNTQTEFDGFPMLAKYFTSINFISGTPDEGLSWICEDGEGGAFDPNLPAQNLERALSEKLNAYSDPVKKAHLAKHGLAELNLLVHADYKHQWYNTPWGHQTTLEEVAMRSAVYYAQHPQRNTFNHVWLFYSIDFAEDLNELVGISGRLRRLRWMAQLWPNFRVFREAAEKHPVL